LLHPLRQRTKTTSNGARYGNGAVAPGWASTRSSNCLARILGNGQRVAGRTDHVLRTSTGWIVFDHKSTPQGSAQWEEVAQKHAGQLAAYREVLEAVSGASVEETWLVLPVAGAALRVELQAPADAGRRQRRLCRRSAP
jgi:hypothetical protein